jgi:DNA-binding NtrC family response regulator
MSVLSSFEFSDRLMPAFTAPTPEGRLLGASPSMLEVLRLIERVAPTDASVLLTGESGSGKELAAHALHDRSARRARPFLVVNCGAIPAGLLETELFGYEKGSMNGAQRAHAGALERASGGTLLLDELTEMPLDIQTRLLRVLETRQYYRVGAQLAQQCDVRVLAATNRCPLTAVRNGQLREDLLYRLAAFPIEMPPLRERGDDAELLAEYFLNDLNATHGTDKDFSAHARDTLKSHAWPGNVRELKNCIERAFILADTTLELAPLLQNPAREESAGYSDGRMRLDIRVGSRIHDMERSLIEATLDYFKGNKRRAADALGCSLKTLYNKLNGYSSQSQELANS